MTPYWVIYTHIMTPFWDTLDDSNHEFGVLGVVARTPLLTSLLYPFFGVPLGPSQCTGIDSIFGVS